MKLPRRNFLHLAAGAAAESQKQCRCSARSVRALASAQALRLVTITLEGRIDINVVYSFDKDNDVAAQIVFCQISAAESEAACP
jgi:hypothetical protein